MQLKCVTNDWKHATIEQTSATNHSLLLHTQLTCDKKSPFWRIIAKYGAKQLQYSLKFLRTKIFVVC